MYFSYFLNQPKNWKKQKQQVCAKVLMSPGPFYFGVSLFCFRPVTCQLLTALPRSLFAQDESQFAFHLMKTRVASAAKVQKSLTEDRAKILKAIHLQSKRLSVSGDRKGSCVLTSGCFSLCWRCSSTVWFRWANTPGSVWRTAIQKALGSGWTGLRSQWRTCWLKQKKNK